MISVYLEMYLIVTRSLNISLRAQKSERCCDDIVCWYISLEPVSIDSLVKRYTLHELGYYYSLSDTQKDGETRTEKQ